MRLRNIEFGCVGNASGGRGFFGEGYAFHRCLGPLGPFYGNATFIAKTTTIVPRTGNMELAEDGITPRRLKPDCVVVKLLKGVVLNAVGLSGPGARFLFEQGRWQKQTEPFFISFAAVGATLDDRLIETRAFVEVCAQYLAEFQAPVCLQVNMSCPNTGHTTQDLAREADAALTILSALSIPLVVKINATVPVAVALYIGNHPACDAISVSNTIPWGMLPNEIDWKGLFGFMASPLARYGGGGLSGKPLLPIVRNFICDLRDQGFQKFVMAGGGVLSKRGARSLVQAGASFIELGSVSIVRSWRVRGIVRCVNTLFQNKKGAVGYGNIQPAYAR